ncbi:MAG: hypothetical protein QG570_20 [Patescibacteria group bacterium]|nr:hypothetical protein [Patescibacteria group bacterium]
MDQVQNKLAELKLTPSNSIVIGSGILNALNIRESADIDLIVTKEKYYELSKNPRFTIVQKHADIEFEVLSDDIFEIGFSWTVINKTWSFSDMLEHSIVIDNVRYITIQFLLEVKQSWLNNNFARPKDIDDIRLIENYIATHNNH